MNLSQISSELIVLIIGIIVYLVKSWLAKKNADLDQKLDVIENIIYMGIAKARSIKKSDTPKELLLNEAVGVISYEINTNSKIRNIVNKIGIDTSTSAIKDYIEIGLHASKLGINGVLKKRFKARAVGAQ